MSPRLAPSRRLDPVLVAAVVLPLVVTAGLAILRPTEPRPESTPPTGAALSRLAVACPAPLGTPAGEVRATRAPGVDGGAAQVRVGKGGRLARRGTVRAGQGVTTVPDSRGATVVTGRGAAAPGLVLGRTESGTAPECGEPWYDDWFLGAGASARQSTVIELVNPDSSTAVVDVEVHGPGGPIEDASWRGIAVAGHRVTRVELAERPARHMLAAHVTVDQGRIRAFARHTFDRLGGGSASSEYLPALREASQENLILGAPTRGAQRALFVTNPGDDQVRATVKVVTGESTLRPARSEEIVVPPRSQRRFPLADHIEDGIADDVLGLVVESTAPVLTGVRALVDDDLVTAGPVTAYDEPMVALLPTGSKTLVAGGATASGTVRVTASDEDGRTIWDAKRFEIAADLAVEVDLPDDAVRIQVRGRNTPVAGAVRVSDSAGSALVRLRPTPTQSEVPAVTPAR